MDKFSPQKRSEIMSRIAGRDTLPERYVRKQFWGNGLRYARADYRLPGSPDLVLPGLRIAIFVHGCFWHGHNCRRAKLPATNRAFWRTKIGSNKRRDVRTLKNLRSRGWHCFQIWQCRLKTDTKRAIVKSLGLRQEEGKRYMRTALTK